MQTFGFQGRLDGKHLLVDGVQRRTENGGAINVSGGERLVRVHNVRDDGAVRDDVVVVEPRVANLLHHKLLAEVEGPIPAHRQHDQTCGSQGGGDVVTADVGKVGPQEIN